MQPKRQEWEEGRWKDDKDHYLHLGVARFIDESELEEAYHRVKGQYDPTMEPDKHKKIEKVFHAFSLEQEWRSTLDFLRYSLSWSQLFSHYHRSLSLFEFLGV